VIDRSAVARALARARDPRDARRRNAMVPGELPSFAADGTRVGDERAILLDWARFPREYLEGPGAIAEIHRAIDALTPRDRAALLVDSEGLELADVAEGLGESMARVRRRLHRARMLIRERLTRYFAAATTPH
jgi:DNA-directed RNA polymerase specialized sigma24 family protein